MWEGTYQPVSTGYLQRAELEESRGEMFNLFLIYLYYLTYSFLKTQ